MIELAESSYINSVMCFRFKGLSIRPVVKHRKYNNIIFNNG